MHSKPQNPDGSCSTFGRRAADNLDHEPTTRDIYALLIGMREHLTRIDSAFVRDDLQEPDYSGHRKSHLSMISAASTLEKFKMDAALKVFGAVALFLLGLLGSGAVEWVKGLVR